MPPEGAVWSWFHRVLLGTVVEATVRAGVGVDTMSLDLAFDEGSIFQFPAMDNRLRFVGRVRGRLLSPITASQREVLGACFASAWPELVHELRRFPLPDRLQVVRNHVTIDVHEDRLSIGFDLDAD